MARTKVISLSMAAASANNICLSQTPGGAGDLTLNGALVVSGVAVIDVARRVRVTTVSNESAKTLTIYGTGRTGATISESMTGPNATTGDTNLDFKTVTRIAVSAAFTGAVTVGTSGIASTQWYPVSRDSTPTNIGFGVSLSTGASMTYSIEHTFADVQNTSAPFDVFVHSAVSGETTSQNDNYAFGISAMRLTTSLYTSGTATLRIDPSGL